MSIIRPVAGQRRPALEARFIGNMSYAITDGTTSLMTDLPYGPIRIEAIEIPHASIGHYSYIVTWHGRRLYFTGDIESTEALLAARNLDVAFVSPWLYRAAVRAGQRIDATQVVIYHHEAGREDAGVRRGLFRAAARDVLRF